MKTNTRGPAAIAITDGDTILATGLITQSPDTYRIKNWHADLQAGG